MNHAIVFLHNIQRYKNDYFFSISIQSSMDFLPNDCLELIFTMLCIVDMIQLSMANRKMRTIYNRIVSLCVKPHTSLKVNNVPLLTEYIEIFRTIPNFMFDRLMIHIDMRGNAEKVMSIIKDFDAHKKSRLCVYDSQYQIDFAPHMKHLVGIHKLTIHGNATNVHDDLIQQHLSTIPSLTFVKVDNLNLTRFTSLESFSLINSNISNVHELKNIRTLNLHGCKNITNVSMLGDVYELDLSDTNVFDVSMLGRVHKLDLTNTKVTDVSMLGRVHELNLTLTKVEDVSMLGNVYHLELTYCHFVKNINTLSSVHTLILACIDIEHIDGSMFENVHSLDLTGCEKLQSLVNIDRIHTLTLSKTNVSDVSMLGRVHTLDLSETNVSDVSMLGRVHTLDLSETNVSDVSMLGRVHTLNLSQTIVSDVSMLGRVHTLNLSQTIVSDVSMLGRVHTLDLSRTKVSDVSALGNVHTLDLSRTKVSDVRALGNVHTLDVSYTHVEYRMLDFLKNVVVLSHTIKPPAPKVVQSKKRVRFEIRVRRGCVKRVKLAC